MDEAHSQGSAMKSKGVRKGLVFFLLHCHWLLSGSPVVGSIVFLDLYCGLLSVMQKKKKKKNYKEWSAKRVLER